MGDMKLEDPLSKLNPKGHCDYYISEFAKAMNCSIRILNNLDYLTQKLSNDYKIDKYRKLVGNIGCRYCGRWYEDNSIWVGLLFDRPVGNKLAIGFYIDSKKTEDEKHIKISQLLSSNYNFYAEYAEIDKGYWFYIFLDYSLEICCSITMAYESIRTIIKDVAKK